RLLPVGQKLWQWLSDHTGQRDAFFDNGAPKPITWRLGSLTDNNPEEPSAAAILCNAPWEILADENGFFVSQGRNKFNVIRSLPSDAEWIEPSDYRPSLLFMAASPTDQKELNYRAEEVAIDGAAGRIGIDLTVEESGSLNELAQTFSLTRAELESIDILHLSAHGGNKSGPLLVLENDTGQSEPVSPETLLSKIPASDLPLAFISSCHGGSGSEFDPGGNFSAELIERGLPAALAWGASVWDDTATDFASACYRELSQGKPLLEAAVLAGRELFNDQDARRQSNWHLPRIFLSASIKQPESVRLTTGSRKPRRQKKDSPEGNFLGGNRLIPIASFKSFVGRRRPLQGTIKAFREDNAVLLLGPGNQGKSSLAGRIARRSHSHKTLVLHGKEINATQLLERIGNLYPDDQVKDLLGPVLSSAEPQQALDTLLPQLLERIDSEHAPLLLVLDDLEQILEIGASLHRPLAERSHTIKAILTCFAAHWGDSRLLFTSRYDFTLNGQHADEHGIDGTSALCRIPLEPFSQNDHSQQLNRYLRSDARFAKLTDEQNQQLSRAMSLANGNPGLLQMLADHIVTAPEHADALLEQVASYLQAGADPTDSKVSDYLHALSIGAMYDQLSEAERALLRIPDYCKAPVPVSALLGEISNALQLDDPQGAIQRLLSFGLWDYHPDIVQPQESACAINHLVKLRLEEKWATFSEEQEQSLCQNLLHALDAAWRQRDGDTSETAEQAHLPLFLLSLQAKDSALCLRHGKPSLQQILLQNQYDVGYALAKSALELISDVSPPLLRICAELAQYAGSGEDADRWFAQAVEATPSAPPSSKEEAWESGMLLNRYGARLSQRGEFDQALDFLQRAITCYETYDLEQNVAITHGRIADIMMHRGQLDDALKIRTEQQLPVFQKLGDIREEAISHGKIADILMHRGELDEALKIRTEQELPVYQKLGDIRSEAVTHGKIADIMMHRGQFDEALKIRTEKE
ncbi:MAG: CHAT domain-containing protein, partial [Desulfuromonadales bacterium]|nr:CHAT domain-containing protein [Desulfuromonadales bacterium]